MSYSPQSIWRYRIFASTWLSNVGFYFCQKPFFIAKPALAEELSWDPSLLGFIGSAYLIAYTIGQFIMGWAGSRWGPRILLLLGMAVSITVNFLLGMTNSWTIFSLLMMINGFAQSTGWSNNVAAMAPWFSRKERGTVMGFWATQYHPEYDLKEMARLIVARADKLTSEGYFNSQDDMMNYINILETIANEPNRKDLRWMAGIDDDLLKDNIRQLEFVNWLKFEMLNDK